ncbi:MAG: sodium:solute symporter [Bernardetiaceae bacterium]
MNTFSLATATWALIAGYGGLVLFFVIRGARRTQSISDYAVGSVSFSPVAVGLSLAASMTSAATFIINPGFIALYGWSGVISLGIVFPLGALVSVYVLTKGFRKEGKAVKALTMAQWIGNRYQNKYFSLFFAFLSLLLITFIVLICVGMTKILSKSLDVEELYVLIGIVSFVFGYMMFGGANAMVYTNMIQAGVMVVVAVILLGSGYTYFSEGITGFFDRLAEIDPLLVANTNPESPLFRDFFEIIFCQIIVGIAVVCQPHIITKSLLLKEEKDVNVYLRTGILVEILFFSVIIVGLYARLAMPDLTINGEAIKMDGIVSAYVVQQFSIGIGLLVVLGLLSAGLSTLEGLVQSLSTTITSDIVHALFGQRFFCVISQIWFNRIVIAFLGIATVLISYDQLINPNLSVGIFAQNGVYAYFSAAFVPVLFGTFLKKVPLLAPAAASLTAVVVHFSIYYGGLTPYTQGAVRNPGVASALAILVSVAVGLLLWKLLPRPKTNKS